MTFSIQRLDVPTGQQTVVTREAWSRLDMFNIINEWNRRAAGRWVYWLL